MYKQHFNSNLSVDTQNDKNNELIDKNGQGIIQSFRKTFLDSQNKSSIQTSALNVINTIVGAGILALPYVFKIFGIIIGSLLMILVYFMSLFSCHLLLKVKNYSGLKDYSQIGHFAFQQVGDIVIKCIITLHNFGIIQKYHYITILGMSISYLILVLGLQDATDASHYFEYKEFYALILGIIMIPFIFARDTEKLKFASSLCLFGMSVFVIAVVVTVIKNRNHLSTEYNWLPPKNFQTNQALSIFTTIFLSFTWHYNFFPIYRSLKQRTGRKMINICYFSVTVVLIVYLLVSFCGYIRYGNQIQTNYLYNAKKADVGTPLFILEYLGFSFIGASSLPLQYFECRNNALGLFRIIKEQIHKSKYKNSKNLILLLKKQIESDSQIEIIQSNGKVNNSQQDLLVEDGTKQDKKIKPIQESKRAPFQLFITFSLILYVIIVICGYFFNNLSVAFDFIGSLLSNSLTFILPCCFYLKLAKNNKWQYKVAQSLLIFSSVAAIISITGTILKLVKGQQD